MLMSRHSLQCGGHQLELGQRTAIMGILNITPDSFSDGGRFLRKDAALSQADKIVADGADILDIGGESSRPFSEPVSAEEETRRVIPVIEHLAPKLAVPISIDTTKAEVARRAVNAGAAIINDISALRFDPAMGKVAAEYGTLLVLMHMKGDPKTMQIDPVYKDLVGEIFSFLKDSVKKAENAGVERGRIIVDPGIGFGKTAAHNLELIDRADRFLELGLPVLLGPSRKAFIRQVLSKNADTEFSPDSPGVEAGTLAAVAAATMKGVHIVRVHDVASSKAAVRIADSIRNKELFS